MPIPIDRVAHAVFLTAILVQLGLGTYRARLLGSSILPALALAALLGAVALLWRAKRFALRGAALAMPVALLMATLGLLSGITAANAPFIGVPARISTPLFALSAAALLVFAEHSPRVQAATLAAFAVAVIVLQMALTSDAWWENQNLPSTRLGMTSSVACRHTRSRRRRARSARRRHPLCSPRPPVR